MARRMRPALEAVTRQAEASAASWRAHRQHCHTCNVAEGSGRPALACEAGFRLWQDRDRDARAEARHRAPDASQAQLTLPLG